MPPPFARIRRTLGRLVGGGPVRAPGLTPPPTTVPVTVRSRTRDDADLRLLLDVHVVASTDGTECIERAVLALVVPATHRWVRRHALADLERDLAPGPREVGADVREELAALGVTLLHIEVVAAEHLLASPSGVATDGPG